MPVVVNKDICVGCGACEGTCPTGAIKLVDGLAECDADTCVDCCACMGVCPSEAISQQ